MVFVPEFLDAGAAVTLRAVLLALGSLLLWIGALALAALALALVQAILWPLNKFVSTITFGVVGSVPGTHTVVQFFTNLLGTAASGVDKAAGSFWHGLKTLVVSVGEEILGVAILAGYVYWWAATKLPGIIWHRFGKLIHAGVGRANAIAHHAEKVALRTEKFAHAQVKRINKEIRAANHAIEVTLPADIANARDLAKEAEDLANNAWDWIKSNGGKLTAAGFAAAVLTALSSIGLGWLKCDSNPFNKSKKPCALWTDLADILGLVVALEAALEFEAFVHDVQKATGATIGAVKDVAGLVD